jgi:hypothetical protein
VNGGVQQVFAGGGVPPAGKSSGPRRPQRGSDLWVTPLKRPLTKRAHAELSIPDGRSQR